jgi:hypothetical protein
MPCNAVSTTCRFPQSLLGSDVFSRLLRRPPREPTAGTQSWTGTAHRSYVGWDLYDRPVPIRPSSFIRMAGILLKRLLFELLFVVEDFAEEGAGDEA